MAQLMGGGCKNHRIMTKVCWGENFPEVTGFFSKGSSRLVDILPFTVFIFSPTELYYWGSYACFVREELG